MLAQGVVAVGGVRDDDADDASASQFRVFVWVDCHARPQIILRDCIRQAVFDCHCDADLNDPRWKILQLRFQPSLDELIPRPKSCRTLRYSSLA